MYVHALTLFDFIWRNFRSTQEVLQHLIFKIFFGLLHLSNILVIVKQQVIYSWLNKQKKCTSGEISQILQVVFYNKFCIRKISGPVRDQAT